VNLIELNPNLFFLYIDKVIVFHETGLFSQTFLCWDYIRLHDIISVHLSRSQWIDCHAQMHETVWLSIKGVDFYIHPDT